MKCERPALDFAQARLIRTPMSVLLEDGGLARSYASAQFGGGRRIQLLDVAAGVRYAGKEKGRGGKVKIRWMDAEDRELEWSAAGMPVLGAGKTVEVPTGLLCWGGRWSGRACET